MGRLGERRAFRSQMSAEWLGIRTFIDSFVHSTKGGNSFGNFKKVDKKKQNFSSDLLLSKYHRPRAY